MIPAGYMYKLVETAPAGVCAHGDADVYALSGCISPYFADYVPAWRHNGHWLFDRPEIMAEVATRLGVDLAGMTLFFYELFGQEYHESTGAWMPVPTELPFPTQVRPPWARRLEGYDVVTFSCGTTPECSPLSCNGLASQISTNRHLLFDSLEMARQSLESGLFDASEPGPFRVFAVYTVSGW